MEYLGAASSRQRATVRPNPSGRGDPQWHGPLRRQWSIVASAAPSAIAGASPPTLGTTGNGSWHALAVLLTSPHGVPDRVLPRTRARRSRVMARRCPRRLCPTDRATCRVRSQSSLAALACLRRRAVRAPAARPIGHREGVLLLHARQACRRAARLHQEVSADARSRAKTGAEAPQGVARWLN